jgi:hypothetical protein
MNRDELGYSRYLASLHSYHMFGSGSLDAPVLRTCILVHGSRGERIHRTRSAAPRDTRKMTNTDDSTTQTIRFVPLYQTQTERETPRRPTHARASTHDRAGAHDERNDRTPSRCSRVLVSRNRLRLRMSSPLLTRESSNTGLGPPSLRPWKNQTPARHRPREHSSVSGFASRFADIFSCRSNDARGRTSSSA